MLKAIDKIERYIVYLLVFLLLVSVILGTLELSRILIKNILDSPFFLVDINRLFESFGLFLILVIGLELLKSIKSYLVLGSINPAFVVEVAIIALGNKLITLDIKHVEPGLLIGIGAILLGLSATYLVLKRAYTPVDV
ncbi:phosphate-starvation-inducible PsiE family protein [Methylocaldum sp.]|uniref:phosphate-starvation-inducible PsiE family protein n=1 Tax=Methylocaldum sp. TaxID=1969727 RepID=UPI002D3A78AA|nr:phosphate-starvation-inducible PsiE family protein [Methylocaldum sp.]HYE36138.1 phosphate-starvation-inducible PsiE family protein [Methylocaldum sp.]